MSNEPKRLYRSRSDKVLGGVCGGIAHYFALDPVLVRVAAVILIICAGSGVLAYLLAWAIIPLEQETPPAK